MKLWSKNDELDKIIEKFTVGKDRYYDMFLAKYDIIASIAHAKMLKKIKMTFMMITHTIQLKLVQF